jgi:NADPH:quinone reductase-like Zn-dependent oxidoreductase
MIIAEPSNSIQEMNMRAVRFAQYGSRDVLDVVDVPMPVPGPDQLLVRVRAAGINPGEAKIREGDLHQRWPATFPSGEGSDLAGVVEELGPGASAFLVGDEVLGFVHTRSSQAEYAAVDGGNLTAKPAAVPWEVAGGLYVAGATAWAMVRAAGVEQGDVVVVAGATGGVGSIAVQLAKLRGATVLGIAGERHTPWLRDHGIVPISYGDGVAGRIGDAARAAGRERPDALLDAHGGGYVELGVELGIDRERIDTIADFAGAATYGVKTEGSMEGSTPAVLAELAGLIAGGSLEVPIAATYPLEQVREAFRALEEDHPLGKIVLLP